MAAQDFNNQEPWNLLKINLATAKEIKYEVAVLPVGATEAHNMHLPEGQDVMHTDYVSSGACRHAWENNAKVLKLPVLPYGVDSNLLAFPYTIHVSQTVLDNIVKEIAASVLHHGIKKFVIVNGHGGNDFTPLIRQLQHEMDIHVFLCNWWQIGNDKFFDIFENPDDHAGEMETSVGLALYPELVQIVNAKDGKARPFRVEAIKKGWIKTSRDFSKLNDHCAAGDPSKAAPEKGRKYLDLAVKRLGDFLTELANASVDESFPFE